MPKVLPVEMEKNHRSTLLTPWLPGLRCEGQRWPRVADAALVVVTAEKGVKSVSELNWKDARRRKTSCIVLVNKLDRKNTHLTRNSSHFADSSGEDRAPHTIPIGEQLASKGGGSIWSDRSLHFEGGNKIQEIPYSRQTCRIASIPTLKESLKSAVRNERR